MNLLLEKAGFPLPKPDPESRVAMDQSTEEMQKSRNVKGRVLVAFQAPVPGLAARGRRAGLRKRPECFPRGAYASPLAYRARLNEIVGFGFILQIYPPMLPVLAPREEDHSFSRGVGEAAPKKEPTRQRERPCPSTPPSPENKGSTPHQEPGHRPTNLPRAAIRNESIQGRACVSLPKKGSCSGA